VTDPQVPADTSLIGAAPASPQAAPVLLYDGVCGLCSKGVQTILRFDRHGTLRFAAHDSAFARAIIERHPSLQSTDALVFVENPGHSEERIYSRSSANLRVAKYLGGPWQVLLVAGLIPVRLRDWLYDRLASVRYRVFGKYDTCPLPHREVRARFLNN